MNITEAKAALKSAQKITHRFFSPEEWIGLIAKDGTLTDESGATLNPVTFWKNREGMGWEEDWSIWEDASSEEVKTKEVRKWAL